MTMPYQPYTGGRFYNQAAASAPRPMRPRATKGRDQSVRRIVNREFYPELGQREDRATGLTGPADEAILNPGQTIDRFRGYYQDLAEGFTAPALRDFRDQEQEVRANVASRFGGNVSGEEFRQGGNYQDQFSRSLSESLARLAPQAVEQGLGYAGQLEDTRARAQSESDQIRQLLLSALLGRRGRQKKKGGGLLGAIGSGLGTAAGAALGGPVGAAIGGSVGDTFVNSFGI